jgi:uncharacterized lipoprotein YajG
MKTLIGAAGLVMLAGCAALTDRTGITAEQQQCAADVLVAMQSDPAAADLRIAQKAALVAQACGIDPTAVILKAAE